MDNAKINPDSIHGMKTPLGKKKFSENKTAYYLFGFNTVIKKATEVDMRNKNVYGMQLVANFHSLVLPIKLLERKTTGTMMSKTNSYYALVGKLVIGILYITETTLLKNTIQLEYTYKYKVDGRNYRLKKDELKTYDNISKRKASVISARQTVRNRKDKHD